LHLLPGVRIFYLRRRHVNTEACRSRQCSDHFVEKQRPRVRGDWCITRVEVERGREADWVSDRWLSLSASRCYVATLTTTALGQSRVCDCAPLSGTEFDSEAASPFPCHLSSRSTVPGQSAWTSTPLVCTGFQPASSCAYDLHMLIFSSPWARSSAAGVSRGNQPAAPAAASSASTPILSVTAPPSSTASTASATGAHSAAQTPIPLQASSGTSPPSSLSPSSSPPHDPYPDLSIPPPFSHWNVVKKVLGQVKRCSREDQRGNRDVHRHGGEAAA
jgi:hypothetical protein